MIDISFMLETSNNLSYIGKEISKQKLTIRDYRKNYSAIINSYNEFLSILNEFLSSKEKSSEVFINNLRRKTIICEIESWKVYINLMQNIIDTSVNNFLFLIKNIFVKDKSYLEILERTKSNRNKLKKSGDLLNNEEKILLYRDLGKDMEKLMSEKLIKNPALFWVILGVIITFLTYLKMKPS